MNQPTPPTAEDAAAKTDPVPPKKVYRGIVVVHGVGEHKKGSYVSGFVEELAKFLCNVEELEKGRVQLTARNRTDTTDTTWATINIDNPKVGEADEEWHIREAWWTRTFEPSKPGRIYLWAILAGLALIWSAANQQLARGILAFTNSKGLQKWPTERVGRPFDRVNHTPAVEGAQGVWRQPEIGRLHSIIDGIVWFFFTLGYLVIGAIGVLLIGVVYLVLVLPLSFIFPAAANAVIKTLIKIIVFTLGDQEAMTTRQLPLAAAANEVNNALWLMLSEEGLRAKRRKDPQFEGFDTITVVAHSGGCVVSMAALKSFEFRRIMTQEATFSEAKGSPKFKRPERINWVTAGSGLNLAWNVRFDSTPADKSLWEPIGGGLGAALPQVNWLNLYARYDPVAQGPAPAGMAEKIAGEDPEERVRAAEQPGEPDTAARPAFVSLRVANTDSPWGDHGSYWSNHAEVMSRIVHVVTKDDLAATALSPDVVGVEAKKLGGLTEAIEAHVATGIPEHRRKVTAKIFVIFVGVATVLGLALALGDDLGRAMLGERDFYFLEKWDAAGDKLRERLPDGAAKKLPGQDYVLRELGLGTAFIALVALIGVEYFRISRWLVGFAQSWQVGRAKSLWMLAALLVMLSTLAVLLFVLFVLPTAPGLEWPWR